MSEKKQELTPEMAKLEEILKAEKLEGEAAQAVKDALKSLAKVPKGTIPEAVFKMLAGMIGYPVPAKEQKSEELPKAPEIPDVLKPQFEAMQKSVADQSKVIEELKKSLDAERDAAMTKEYHEKAAGLKHIPGKTEEIAEIMKAIANKDKEIAEKLENLLKSTEAALEKSAAFSEMGTTASDGGSSDNETKADKLAKEKVEKSEGKLTYEQAYAEVLSEKPELFQ